jgi:hypothetical protein
LRDLDPKSVGILTVSIFAGNFLADRARRRIGPTWTTRIEYGTLLVCTTLAVFGLTK